MRYEEYLYLQEADVSFSNLGNMNLGVIVHPNCYAGFSKGGYYKAFHIVAHVIRATRVHNGYVVDIPVVVVPLQHYTRV